MIIHVHVSYRLLLLYVSVLPKYNHTATYDNNALIILPGNSIVGFHVMNVIARTQCKINSRFDQSFSSSARKWPMANRYF